MSLAQYDILHPVLAMLVLSFVVWIWMFATRFHYFARKKIDPQSVNTPTAVYRTLPPYAANPGYNFGNLFEMPVLFYVICFYLAIAGGADHTHLVCAWLFVGFRALHSLIQVTYNRVSHRFGAYAVASIALWVMVGRAVIAAL